MIEMGPSPTKLVNEPAVWREGDLVVICLSRPLPPQCLLSGQPATKRVRCLFHWQERPFAAAGILSLLRHYAQDVWKVPLDVPLADELMRRRQVGWALLALSAVLAAATIASLFLLQMDARLAAGAPGRNVASDWVVALVAVGGFLLTGLAALASYQVMPMPTVRLKPVRVTDTHLWLSGAAPEYLAQLPEHRSS